MAKYSHFETDQAMLSIVKINQSVVVDIVVTHMHFFVIPKSRGVFARFARSSNQVRYELLKASS